MALSKRRRMSSRNRQIEFLARFITDKKKSVTKRLMREDAETATGSVNGILGVPSESL
jgi:hypothetical protein